MAEEYLLESGDPVAVAGVYVSVVRRWGIEMAQQIDQKFSANNAGDWFETIRRARKDAKVAVYDSPEDPRFTLKESITQGSPVQLAIAGFDHSWQASARDLKRRLDRWQHFSVNPNSENLEPVVSGLWDLSLKSQLPMSEYLGKLATRVRNIRDGVYEPSPVAPSGPAVAPEDSEYVAKLEAKVQEQIMRPPVGADWVGEIGSRKIKISKELRDVTENGVSIRAELGDAAEERVKAWLRYYPKGGEAAVSADGAVMGFVKGQPKLIGWLNALGRSPYEEPEGFLLDHDYLFTGNDVLDVATGTYLSKVAQEPVDVLIAELSKGLSADTHFVVTNYGQAQLDADTKPVAMVNPGIWFKGHLAS